ncbi:hypothetical protein EON68_04055 [archaeon]|nr:MAG: hypothetical protein EON68_04055 [archaeon]
MSFFSSLFNSSSGGGSSRAAAATAASGAGAPAIHSELVIDPEHLRSLRIMGTREAAVIVSGTPDGAVVTGMSHAWTTVEVRAPAGAEFPLPEYMEVTVLQTPAREASVCFGITAEDSTVRALGAAPTRV